MEDNIHSPKHYRSLGAKCPKCNQEIECIDVTSKLDFMTGNAMKYLWRAGNKGDAVEDLQKAKWYITRKINELLAQKAGYIGYCEDHCGID